MSAGARPVLAGERLSRCGRCGETKPRTPEFFYFAANGYRTGYCRACQGAYWRTYWPHRVTEYQRERRRAQQRLWWRRRAQNHAEAQGLACLVDTAHSVSTGGEGAPASTEPRFGAAGGGS